MKVWPTSDKVRQVLKHPARGGFRDHGPADWPDDTFTYRRIKDGDVTTKEPKEPKEAVAERRRATTKAEPEPEKRPKFDM
jgi:hypothetical protein